MDLAHPFAGFVVGLLVGLTGVGGGALMTPILVYLFGVSPQMAVGTDLLFATLTKSTGVWLHGARGSIDWQVLRRLCLGSVPAAAITLLVIRDHYLDFAAIVILQILGIALVLTSLAMISRPYLLRISQRMRTEKPIPFKAMQPALTVVGGAILGVLVTLTSVGAGALGVVMLVYLYPFRLSSTKLVGTDIAHAVPLTLVAGFGHMALGNVDLTLLFSLLLGSIPGIILGSLLGHKVNDKILRNLIAIVLFLVGCKIILR